MCCCANAGSERGVQEWPGSGTRVGGSWQAGRQTDRYQMKRESEQDHRRGTKKRDREKNGAARVITMGLECLLECCWIAGLLGCIHAVLDQESTGLVGF